MAYFYVIVDDRGKRLDETFSLNENFTSDSAWSKLADAWKFPPTPQTSDELNDLNHPIAIARRNFIIMAQRAGHKCEVVVVPDALIKDVAKRLEER